jgi:hypothetical protein
MTFIPPSKCFISPLAYGLKPLRSFVKVILPEIMALVVAVVAVAGVAAAV